jgi:hypothetical protein
MSEKMHPIRCRPEDEHILRRLGAAVLIVWDSLSNEVQSRLVREATFMMDRETKHTSLEHQIKAFIRKHKPADA